MKIFNKEKIKVISKFEDVQVYKNKLTKDSNLYVFIGGYNIKVDIWGNEYKVNPKKYLLKAIDYYFEYNEDKLDKNHNILVNNDDNCPYIVAVVTNPDKLPFNKDNLYEIHDKNYDKYISSLYKIEGYDHDFMWGRVGWYADH